MQLLTLSPSSSYAAARKRLSKALQLEAYFRYLLSQNHANEVFSQWSASRRLVDRAFEDYAAGQDQRADAARPGAAG
jgi:hypothetical protein